jgi:inner membrane protein
MPVHVIWFLIAIALLVLELASTTFYAIFLALGAVAAGLVAFFFPESAGWLQAVIAVAVAIAGVAVVRPILGRRLQSRGTGAVSPGVHGGFVGQRALSTDVIGDELHPGHVRLAGELWMAFTDTHQQIDAGAPVIVSAVRGTTLLVRPAGPAQAPAQIPEA